MEGTRNASPYLNGEDRISRLPDGLIHHIMSFIDTKFAVQTCVLSKRWIHIWKSLPFLNFKRSLFSRENAEKFITLVDVVFIFHDDTDIQKFSVDWENCEYDNSVIMHVNRWILNAVKFNVQEITTVIEKLQNSAYEIPQCLLNCKSLRKLVIEMSATARYVDITLPRSIYLPRLELLVLDGLSFSNVELAKKLLSSCPVLQTLEIVDCNIQTDDQRNLIVDSANLKKFYYTCWLNHSMPRIIKLRAPILEKFNCRSLLTEDYSLENCSPLSKVDLCMILKENEEDENAETYSNLPSEEKEVYAIRMMKSLGAVYMVKRLRLSPGFLEVLSRAPDLLDYQPPRLCNLKCLTVAMWPTRGCLRALAYLLSISPNIDTIYLEQEKSNLADVGDDWESGLSSPEMLSHLKYVLIEEAEGCDAEFKILRFFLKNAKVLKGVSIFFRYSVGLPDGAGKMKHFKKQLRSVPTASSSVELVFTKT